MKTMITRLRTAALVALCMAAARWRTLRSRLEWWPVRGARMAWPVTGAGSEAIGVLIDGKTTIRWGTKEVVTSIDGGVVNGTNVAVVTSANQRRLVAQHNLPNGDGPTITRVLIVDGNRWELTIRDDSGINKPDVGTTVVVVDMAGYLGAQGVTYATRVVEGGYSITPAKEGEFNITVERLLLVDV